MLELLHAWGRYDVRCFGADGVLKWREEFDNIIATVGKNLALDTYLAGAGYTVTGPFMGLITSTSFTGVAASDTMASHPGWLEGGNANLPSYTAPRPTISWTPAASGQKVGVSSFSIFGATAIVKGAFVVFGPGATSIIDSATGVLYSAGLFTQGDQTVTNGDTVNVTYTTGL